MLAIQELNIEYRQNPIGIDCARPRFSRILTAGENDTVQTNYALSVSTEGVEIWHSGIIQDAQSVLISYAGPALIPMTQYQVSLAVTDNHGNKAEAAGSFETGLMTHENWKAGWITHGYEDKAEPCPVYTRTFPLSGKVAKARVYASALGIYELTLNGQRVGDAFLAPGWTSYHNRIQYQTYDITGLLSQSNCIAFTTANGWYSGPFGFMGETGNYGTRTAAICQIELWYEDGMRETIVTDDTWSYGTGKCRFAEIYHGEQIDMTFTPTQDGRAIPYDHATSILTAQESEPVRVTQRLKAQKMFTTPKGEIVLDFGQNLVGVVEAKIKALRGTRITLRHAETLDKDGNFYTENLRAAKATDVFVCSGGDDTFMPFFTFHGFRYAQVEGLGDAFCPDDFTACVLHTDMRQIGEFTCSHPGVNRLWQNIGWGQRGNFLDIPTDCPQRDERLGWTGDAQVFASTAAYRMNTALFFTKWLRDLSADQTPEYGVPHVVPDILHNKGGAAAWGDAATVIPWAVYQAYGDEQLLREQYPSMKNWVEYIRSQASGSHLWQSGHQYGDWLALDIDAFSDRVGATDVYLIATAYYALSASLVAKAAQALGYTEDAAAYTALAGDIRSAFRKEFVTATGRLVSETQTGLILALHFELAEEAHRKRIEESLIANLRKHNNHLMTGFVGTPYLCHTLSEIGQHELAGDVFLKEDYPSWLHCVGLGATTIWERWDSQKPDGSFDESGMNSFNHYAYGSIGSWMAEKLGGLNIVEPGYKKSRIEPRPILGITMAEATLQTMYGTLGCRWECKNGIMTVDIKVPVNTTALVRLPDQDGEITVGSGDYHYEYETSLALEKERYSMDSTLGEVLDNPLAMQLMERYSPGMTDNPMIRFAYGHTLNALTAMMPEGGVDLMKEIVRQLNAAEK